MNSEDENVESNIFDLPNSVNPQIFAFDSDRFKLLSSDDYLRENIGEPLSYALSYVIIYRPEDAIEFIANFLINWSRKTTCQKSIDQETNSILTQCFTDKQQKKEAKDLLNKHNEEQQQVFKYDKHLLTSYQENFHNKPHTDDEREPSIHFQEQKQQTHRINTSQYTYTHDTASGFDDDDEMKSNQEKSYMS